MDKNFIIGFAIFFVAFQIIGRLIMMVPNGFDYAAAIVYVVAMGALMFSMHKESKKRNYR